MDYNDLIAAIDRVKAGAAETFGHGREDYREALKRAYGQEGRDTDGAKFNQMLGSNRTISMTRDLLGLSNPEHQKARDAMGLGLSPDRATRTGQILGTIGSDLVQDRGREVWWLLNAPQAVANVLQDSLLHKFAPEMYQTDIVNDVSGVPISSQKAAQMAGLVDDQGLPVAGINVAYENIGATKNGKPIKSKIYRKRKHRAGYVDALAIPAGLAVNTGIGLMNPFGGQEGYKAVLPSDEDPSKTNNVIGEIASKYILGKTGNLLPWDEFKKVRPDVSKDEYMRYKAFKFDNDADLNPFDDGQVILPTGVAKYTSEGIHGPEVQFLGRSMPLTTAILPTAAALAGTTIGARGPKGSPGRALKYGLGSTLGGMVAGNLLEQERRRRNKAENETDTISM